MSCGRRDGPLNPYPSSGSVDGYSLPIDELKGSKPTKSIDLSGKSIGVASSFIIAACIKDNASLETLK